MSIWVTVAELLTAAAAVKNAGTGASGKYEDTMAALAVVAAAFRMRLGSGGILHAAQNGQIFGIELIGPKPRALPPVMPELTMKWLSFPA